MKLLIVESPGKIKKLKSFLDKDWEVVASVGHFRDLPVKDYGLQSPDFKPVYTVSENKKSVVDKLKAALRKADDIYLASDPDREGEAIAWHLKDHFGLKHYKRVTYTAITREDVLAGIEAYRDIDMNLVHAQEARRGLDRLVGFNVSFPLGQIVGVSTASAGRVQSPAVRIIVDREREIRAFKSTTHFGVETVFEQEEGEAWKAVWLPKEGFLEDGQEYILDKALAESVAGLRSFKVLSFEEKEAKSAPPAPFTTSTLQQAASNALKFTPKRTMDLAQKLYEGGHITYMRTDSPNLSDAALKEIRAYAEEKGLPLSDKPRSWKSKAGAQEAHEAIRPTHIEAEEVELEQGSGMDARFVADAAALYKLIRVRTLACQLADAIYSVRVVRLEAPLEDKHALFEARGRTLVSPGWTILTARAPEEEDEEDPRNPIPVLREGGEVTASDAKVVTRKTKPKSRFKQASLIKELEKRGIGRPATYASILDNIMSRAYLKEEKGFLVPTALGEKIVDALKPQFSFLDLDFTRYMESALDDVAEGKITYASCMRSFHDTLMAELATFRSDNALPCPKCGDKEHFRLYSNKDGSSRWWCRACETSFDNENGKPGRERVKPAVTDFACEQCGKPLNHIKTEKYDFFACSAPREACGATYDNVDGKPVSKELRGQTEFTCEKCGKPLKHIKTSKYDFFACTADKEECGATYNNVDGKPVARKSREVTEYTCKKCGKPLTLFEGTGKNGKPYKKFNCTGFPRCKQFYWGKDDGTPNFEAAG